MKSVVFPLADENHVNIGHCPHIRLTLRKHGVNALYTLFIDFITTIQGVYIKKLPFLIHDITPMLSETLDENRAPPSLRPGVGCDRIDGMLFAEIQ